MFARALDEKDWKTYRDLRLEALYLHGGNYGSSYAEEASWSDTDWKNMLSGHRHKFFGLFDGAKMFGIGAAFTDREDASGKTALLAAGYIRESYRRKGYSRLLYRVRMQWVIESGLFDRIRVGHRAGNEASRRANQAFGFDWVRHEEKVWGDGSTETIHIYEVRLK